MQMGGKEHNIEKRGKTWPKHEMEWKKVEMAGNNKFFIILLLFDHAEKGRSKGYKDE